MKGKACPERWKLTGRSFSKKVTTHYGSEGTAHALPLEMRGWLRLAGGHARGFYRYLF